jgi:uncharacterized protein YkwD
LRIRPLHALLLCAVLLALPASAAAACRYSGLRPRAHNLARVNSATLCLLNAARKRHGLRPLHRNRRLDRAAMRWSEQMVARGIFTHADPVARIRATGYLRGARSWAVGENIAWGSRSKSTPRRIVNDWLRSPEHRGNILNGRFRDIGLGVAAGTPAGDGGGTYTNDVGRRG